MPNRSKSRRFHRSVRSGQPVPNSSIPVRSGSGLSGSRLAGLARPTPNPAEVLSSSACHPAEVAAPTNGWTESHGSASRFWIANLVLFAVLLIGASTASARRWHHHHRRAHAVVAVNNSTSARSRAIEGPPTAAASATGKSAKHSPAALSTTRRARYRRHRLQRVSMQLAQHSATSPIPHPAISLPAPHIRLASFRRPTRATFQPPTLPPIVPVKPVSPAMPKWPVNEQPQPASVVWNGHELSVSATNSSLVQILNEISTATGLKVEGISADQRIFGTYGPAPARDILAQLMDGSDYSVMIVGDKGQGVPRELVLSAKISVSDLKRPNGAQTSNADDDSTDEPEPVEQPIEPTRRPLGGMPQPPQGPRTPQQMMQELQQRQQQMLAHPTPQ